MSKECPECRWRLLDGDVDTCPICGASLPELHWPDAGHPDGEHSGQDALPEGKNSADVFHGMSSGSVLTDTDHNHTQPEWFQQDAGDSMPGFETMSDQQEESEPERGILSLLFSPSGRIGRRSFLLGNFLIFCFLVAAFLLEVSLSPFAQEDFTFGMSVACFIAIAAWWMVGLKRVHDTGASGGKLFTLTLFLGTLPWLWFTFASPDRRPNAYGVRTRQRWDFSSIVIASVLVLCGTYATIVLSLLEDLEVNYSNAWSAYEQDHLDAALTHFSKVTRAARAGQNLCPICQPFAAYEMYSTWATGDILGRTQQWDAAVRSLTKSQQLAVDRVSASFIPEIESELKDIRMALVVALQVCGKEEEAAALRKKMQLSHDDQTAIEDWYIDGMERIGFQYQADNNFTEAKEVFTQLINRETLRLTNDPSNHELRSRLASHYDDRARAWIGRENADEAWKDLEQAIRLQQAALDSSPSNPRFIQLLGIHHSLAGYVHLPTGHTQKAVEAWEKLLELDPTNLDARRRAARLRYFNSEFDQCTALLVDRNVSPYPNA